MRAPVASGLLCSGLAMLLTMSASAAETGPIETSSEPPRRVGWFLGDRLAWHGRIVAPEGFELDPASLPQPGPIDNFTEIGSIAVEDCSNNSTLFAGSPTPRGPTVTTTGSVSRHSRWSRPRRFATRWISVENRPRCETVTAAICSGSPA